MVEIKRTLWPKSRLWLGSRLLKRTEVAKNTTGRLFEVAFWQKHDRSPFLSLPSRNFKFQTNFCDKFGSIDVKIQLHWRGSSHKVKMKECPNYTSAGTEWVRYQANTIIIFINNILGISNRGAVQTQEHHLAEIDCDWQRGGRLQDGQGLFLPHVRLHGLLDPGLLISNRMPPSCSRSWRYLYTWLSHLQKIDQNSNSNFDLTTGTTRTSSTGTSSAPTCIDEQPWSSWSGRFLTRYVEKSEMVEIGQGDNQVGDGANWTLFQAI